MRCFVIVFWVFPHYCNNKKIDRHRGWQIWQMNNMQRQIQASRGLHVTSICQMDNMRSGLLVTWKCERVFACTIWQLESGEKYILGGCITWHKDLPDEQHAETNSGLHVMEIGDQTVALMNTQHLYSVESNIVLKSKFPLNSWMWKKSRTWPFCEWVVVVGEITLIDKKLKTNSLIKKLRD